MADRLAAYPLPNGAVLALEHGDLTEAALDAIVNAANAPTVAVFRQALAEALELT